MKDKTTIAAMRDSLDDNIRTIGWDAEVSGAYTALEWVLSSDSSPTERVLRTAMARPEEERRRDWIARGGDPKGWPDEPEPTP